MTMNSKKATRNTVLALDRLLSEHKSEYAEILNDCEFLQSTQLVALVHLLVSSHTIGKA